MDMANGQAQGQDTSSPGVINSSAPQAQTAPVQSSDERVFRQSEVNEIVKKAKFDAEERTRRLYSEQPDYAARKYGETQPSTADNHNQISQPQSNFNENHFRQLAAQEAQRLRDEWVQEARTKAEADNAQRIVQTFWNKLEPGRQKYQDFDEVTANIEYGQFPAVVQLLAQYSENAHDVLYEMGKDRIKMGQLEYLASKSPRDAIIQVQRLSESLKKNETAAKYRTPNEPLSQLRPTNQGTDNGVMGVSDFRKKYKG